MQAAADREAARFARLRAAVTARRAERHRQAERLRALDQAGKDALAHADALPGIRDATAEDLERISDLEAGIRDRIGKWNAGLQEIADRAAGLDPEPVLPGGHARAEFRACIGRRTRHSASGGRARARARHQRGQPGAPHRPHRGHRRCGAGRCRPHDTSERLYVAPNGLVLPVGRDPGGHVQKQIDAGELHELTLGERKASCAGEGAPHVS